MVDCGVKLFKEGGLRSIYRGTGITLLRDVPGSIAWFGAYEVIKGKISEATNTPANELNPLIVMCAGGCAGVANWTVSIPPDVVKSRYQTAPEGLYSSTLHCATSLLKEEGAGAFFKGIGPAMIRAFPANAAAFLGMETAKKMLSGRD
jgi:solute carrier family 25 carnitine/acylcarnitine transporter 20/29